MTKNGVSLLIDAMSYQYPCRCRDRPRRRLAGAQFVIKNPTPRRPAAAAPASRSESARGTLAVACRPTRAAFFEPTPTLCPLESSGPACPCCGWWRWASSCRRWTPPSSIPALPAMAQSLGRESVAHAVGGGGHSLAAAMLIPASGWIADRFGPRRAHLGAISAFVLGSVLCALSPRLDLPGGCSGAAGLGGALLLPVGVWWCCALSRATSFACHGFCDHSRFGGAAHRPNAGGWLVGDGILALDLSYQRPGRPGWLHGHAAVHAASAGCLRAASMPRATACWPLAWSRCPWGLDGLSGLGMGQAAVLLLMVFGLASVAAYWLHAARAAAAVFSPAVRAAVAAYRAAGNLFARLGSGSMPLPWFLCCYSEHTHHRRPA